MQSIEEYISKLPAGEKKIVIKLREIVLDTLPGVTEKFSYGVPYYFLHSRICFIWPASSAGGKIKKGVSFGFCKGHLLSNEQGILERGGRTQVYTVIYTSEKQIKEQPLKEILAEAIMLDERAPMAGHIKNKK
jgi:hypothetical protein